MLLFISFLKKGEGCTNKNDDSLISRSLQNEISLDQQQIVVFILNSDPYYINKDDQLIDIKYLLYSHDFDKKINAELTPFVVKQIEIYNNNNMVKNIAPIMNQSLNSENIILFRSNQFNETDTVSFEFSFYLKKEEGPKILIYAYDKNNSGIPLYNGKEIYEETSENGLFNKGEKFLQPGFAVKIAIKSIFENETINFHYCIANLDFRNSSIISTVIINGSQFISNKTSDIINIQGDVVQILNAEDEKTMNIMIIITILIVIAIIILLFCLACLIKRKKCNCLYVVCCKCPCCPKKVKKKKETPKKKYKKDKQSGEKSKKKKIEKSSTKKDGEIYDEIPVKNEDLELNEIKKNLFPAVIYFYKY